MDFHLGLGWNLGNQMDAFRNGVAEETCWGNGVATQQTFDSLKALGFTSVRIPVTWLGHVGPAPEYKIDTTWLDRVAELVGYAEKAGLKAIVNIHHDGADSKHWLDVKKAAKSDEVNRRVKEQL
jgi:endoglucanase